MVDQFDFGTDIDKTADYNNLVSISTSHKTVALVFL